MQLTQYLDTNPARQPPRHGPLPSDCLRASFSEWHYILHLQFHHRFSKYNDEANNVYSTTDLGKRPKTKTSEYAIRLPQRIASFVESGRMTRITRSGHGTAMPPMRGMLTAMQITPSLVRNLMQRRLWSHQQPMMDLLTAVTPLPKTRNLMAIMQKALRMRRRVRSVPLWRRNAITALVMKPQPTRPPKKPWTRTEKKLLKLRRTR